MISFYQDMWRHHAHILALLTALTKVSNKKFGQHWNAECAPAFAKVKAMICHEVLLSYPNLNLPYITMPNNTRIRVTHTCTVNIPGIPHAACSGHVSPHLSTPLVSIGQLCDHDCMIATFNKTQVVITRYNTTILTGRHNPHTNLCRLPLSSNIIPSLLSAPTNNATQHQANNAYVFKKQTRTDPVSTHSLL
jgi:hypothetical protein